MNSVIVVFGHKTAQVCLHRVNASVEKYNQIREQDPLIRQWIVLCGTQDETDFMLECLKDKLPEFPLTRTYMCDSNNTRESVVAVYNFCISTIGIECEIIWCTSRFHLQRVVVVTSILNQWRFNIAYHSSEEKYHTDYSEYERNRIHEFLDKYV
jgi:hypothetical protein